MGSLTTFLQRELIRRPPAGWVAQHEVRLLLDEDAARLGYAPRADVLLIRQDSAVRLWIEFEVSRADPVANHAKFATAHLFHPQAAGDHFLAMLSPHIDRGRRDLAAAAVRLMRRVGMRAFQTTLLPLLTPAEVQQLNQLPVAALGERGIDVGREVERALAVFTPVGTHAMDDIHLAGDVFDVMLNVRGWNDDLVTEDGRRVWGSRACSYFVYDPVSTAFAPCKFCAYLPVRTIPAAPDESTHRMSVAVYTAVNDGTHLLDGGRAWQHLARELGFRFPTDEELPTVAARFADWLQRHGGDIRVKSDAPTFLLPPSWYLPAA